MNAPDTSTHEAALRIGDRIESTACMLHKVLSDRRSGALRLYPWLLRGTTLAKEHRHSSSASSKRFEDALTKLDRRAIETGAYTETTRQGREQRIGRLKASKPRASPQHYRPFELDTDKTAQRAIGRALHSPPFSPVR